MPPSGFSKKAIEGALQFIGSCYEDLLEEVKSGKHPNAQAAIEYELRQIKNALDQLHINKHGKLVRRLPGK